MVARQQIVEYLSSLQKALDEHKGKSTPTGHPNYQGMYEQLVGDLAMLGVGKDQIADVAKEYGHGTTLARLESLIKKPIGFSR